MDERVPTFFGVLLVMVCALAPRGLRSRAARVALVVAAGVARIWAIGEYPATWWRVALDRGRVAFAAFAFCGLRGRLRWTPASATLAL